VFGVECADLGELNKIRIGHDGAGFGSGWFLDKVYFASICFVHANSLYDRSTLAIQSASNNGCSCAEGGSTRARMMAELSASLLPLLME
jgi:hypothetical protein